MAKLSTKAIKTLMSTWLSQSSIREDLDCHTGVEGSTVTQEFLDRIAEWFEFKKGCTQAELEAHVWSMWCDVSQWKRREKRRLGGDWEWYFCVKEDNTYEFGIDFAGSADQQLVTKHVVDAERCILRLFYPDNALANNYRLEVVTTPDDDAVVGWTIVVD